MKKRAGKIQWTLTEREASDLLGYFASNKLMATERSEKAFYGRLENKLRAAWNKQLGKVM